MATFRKLSSGKWQAIVRKKGFPQQYKSFDKKVLAVRWASRIEEEIESGLFVDRSQLSSFKIIDLLDEYVKEVAVNHASRGMRSALNSIKHFGMFDTVTAETINPSLLLDYIKFRRSQKNYNIQTEAFGPASSGTVRKELNLFKQAIDYAKDIKNVDIINPVAEAKRLAQKYFSGLLVRDQERDVRLAKGDEKKLETIPYHGDIPINTIALFVLDTAMRRQEIADFNIHNVDPVEKTYQIQKSKTDHQTGEKGRRIPLSDRIMRLIGEQVPFIDGKLFPWPRDSISGAWKIYAKSVGIKDVRFHDLRHEATSRLFEMGLQIQEVAVFTGHRDWESLKRYTHLKPKFVGDKVRELAERAKQCVEI